MDFNVIYYHVISVFTNSKGIWIMTVFIFLCMVLLYYKFSSIKKIDYRTFLCTGLYFSHKNNKTKKVNNVSELIENNLNQDNCIEEFLKTFEEFENSSKSFLQIIVELEQKYRKFYSHIDILKQEKKEISNNLKLENKLRTLANELPSYITKSGDFCIDIKDYIISCKLKDEENRSTLQEYKTENINLQDKIENLTNEKEKLSKQLKDVKNLADKQVNALNSNTQDLKNKIATLKIFCSKWKETAESIDKIQKTEYENQCKDLIDQIIMIKNKIPNNQEAAILLLDVITKKTSDENKNIKNNPRPLDIPNFFYYLECLVSIFEVISENLPEPSNEKEIVYNKYRQVKDEYNNLISKNDDSINDGIHRAIPNHFIKLCSELDNFSLILLKNKQYDESEAMIEALKTCIEYTKKLYDDQNYRNLLKILAS
jgi:chromosome segregation ATPase